MRTRDLPAALLALAALLHAADAVCSYALSLAAGAPAAPWDPSTPRSGWCTPFLGSAAVNASLCGAIAVPGGAVLSFGTCALPGAACTGSTSLSLLDASGATVAAVGRVPLNSSVAAVEQGCVLGVHCSYDEWLNPGLGAAAVAVAQQCAGKGNCAGVTAWRLLEPDPARLRVLPAPVAATTPGVAFAVTASTAVSLTGVAGSARAGAAVAVYGRVNPAPFAPGALANGTLWTLLWSGSWPGAAVTFTQPLVLPAAGAVAGLVVVTTPATDAALTCAHTLRPPGAQLLADDALSIGQGGAIATFGVAGSTLSDDDACAWDALSLQYDAGAACASPPPPAPPPRAATPLSTTMLALSLEDLLNAMSNSSVTNVVVNAPIVLNGNELTAALGSDGSRRLTVDGGNGCQLLPDGPLCSISAAGASRVFAVTAGLQLTLSNLLLRDGVAPTGGFGGCVLQDCANCSLTLYTLHLSNCSALGAGGGGLAVMGGGPLTARLLEVDGSTAALGGGMMVADGALLLQDSTFHNNTASGSAATMVADAVALSDLSGPSGGGAALYNVSGNVSSCTFSGNAASTTDFVLVANPGVEQARGGGLFVFASALRVTGSTLARGVAAYGGGLYAEHTTITLDTCALTGNTATLGDGGGAFVKDCDGMVLLQDTFVSGNAAGGHIGGGVAVLNASLTVAHCTLMGNAAPEGCGGALGLDVGATLSLQGSSTVSGNAARAGGGLCCIQCADMSAVDSILSSNVALADSGGAIYSTLTPTTVHNMTLKFNRAPAGGAIGAVSATLNVTDSSLGDNHATGTHGGAIFHEATDDAQETLSVSRTVLANNTCLAAGGAVAAFSSASAAFSACRFLNNSITAAAPTGGAVMSLGVASLAIANCTFSQNWVRKVSELQADARLGYVVGVAAVGAGSGGAVWVGADDPVVANISGTVFDTNWGATGGCVYATGATNLSMSWSTLSDCHAYGESSEGGGLMTDMTSTALVTDSVFFSCEAVRGGAGWHGATSQTSYRRCVFEDNEGKPGDDTKGSALYVGEDASSLNISDSQFLNNQGEGSCGGTVAMARSEFSQLRVNDSTFDGNVAHQGGAIYTAAYRQAAQLWLSGVAFTNNRAYIGGALFSAADVWGDLECAPSACNASGNAADDYGADKATPAKHINVFVPEVVRSGAPLPVTVTLTDGFDELLAEWENCVVTITTDAALTGSTRAFYASGAAVFSALSLKGYEATAYELQITVAGPNLFGNDELERSVTVNVTVQACELGETYNYDAMDCACATGYGLVVDDHTCRACKSDEVVPPGDLSCATCPALSAPVAPDQCECIPGYFGLLVGATGGCTQCPTDTYRSADDPPEACIACPPTSHTFAPGATSEKDCLCALNTFNDLSAVNASFSCAAVPEGGWAPQADSRLFALEGYWRPNANTSRFFKCTAGMCLREEPADDNSTQLGYNCREGHTGHLCAVCDAGYALQGIYCSHCKPGSSFDDWEPARKGGMVFAGVFLLLLATFVLFFLPLFPRVEAVLDAALSPAVNGMERALGNLTAVSRPRSAAVDSGVASRPTSAGHARPRSAGARPMSRERAVRLSDDVNAPRASNRQYRQSNGGAPMLRRRSISIALPRRSEEMPEGEAATFSVAVERPSRVRIFFDVIAEPFRTIVSFWQVVSSFSNTMYVPWPSIYYALASTLNVASLQFLRLPSISCVQPDVSFLTVFNGVTISTLLFLVFCAATYVLGQRTKIAREDPERRRRFKARVLSCTIWGIFLIYPQVSSTTLLIFACSELENNTSWLMADYRIQCWTPQHRMYVGVGVLWTILYPIGIPLAFIFLLYGAKVPHLSIWKRDCAWLRALVQRAMVLGVRVPGVADPDGVTRESISMDGLRVLHKLFMGGASKVLPQKTVSLPPLPQQQRHEERRPRDGDEDEKHHKPPPEKARPPADSLATAPGLTVRQMLGVVAAAVSSAHAEEAERTSRRPPALMASGAQQASQMSTSALMEATAPVVHDPIVRRGSTQLLRGPRGEKPLPINPWIAALERARRRLSAKTHAGTKTLRRTLSTLMYHGNEHDFLLGALLEWARHDKASMVSEPRNNLMRWRTVYEWNALRAAGVELGERDTAERAAFFKYQFLFVNYGVHAWYWESVDLCQKLFLCSVIAFVAPHTSTQVIVACMFAFGMVLLTIQVKPFAERSNNQLVALSQINIFLFLFTGLLLQTNPDGVTDNRLLFSVVVGLLTTSIVAFTMYLFLRELFYQLLAALHEIDEEEAADELEWEQSDEAMLALEAANGSGYCDDGADEPGAWRAPPLMEEEPVCCSPTRRLALILAACLALAVGLGVGLSNDNAGGGGAAAVPVTRFTLVVARGAVLAGSTKPGIMVNGTSPGPVLRVPVGSRLEVTVINAMVEDTTAVHWHGMSQRGTPWADGVLGITQCGVPAAKGYNSFTYSFMPDHAGTFWYHGHYRGQYPDGLIGALIIDDGGAAFNAAAAAAYNGTNTTMLTLYDRDEWVWMTQDWYELPATELLETYLSPSGGDEPIPDAILVNGKRSGTELVHTTLRSQKQLVRVINSAAMSMFRISVDGLPLTVVELDGIAIQPFDVPYVDLNAAQRAAVVLDWSRLDPAVKSSPAVWFRIDNMPAMFAAYDPDAPDFGLYGSASGVPYDTNWRGLIRFEEDMKRVGTAAMPNYTLPAPELLHVPVPQDLLNLPAARSWPLAPAPDATHTAYMEIAIGFDAHGVKMALMNGHTASLHSMGAQLAPPELHAYLSSTGGPLTDEDAPLSGVLHGSGASPFILPLGAVVEMMINNTDRGEHPFHLHGHDFWVVATAAAPDAEQLYGPHFVRRDVVSIPAYGWARVRFVADNPGIFLWHCHLDWHMHIGMMVTFVEAPSELTRLAKAGTLVVPPEHLAACKAPLAPDADPHDMRRR